MAGSRPTRASRRRERAACVALALLGAAWCSRARASGVNVERERPDKPGVTGNLDFKFGYRQGNVNLIDTGLKTRLTYLEGRHLILFFSDSRFAAQTKLRAGDTIQDLGTGRARFVNRHMAHARYNVRMIRWMASELFTQIETDEFLTVRTRFLIGAGPRFVLHERRDFGAYLGTAYMTEYEALDSAQFVSQPDATGPVNWWHRWSSYVSLRFLATDRLTLASATYVQPRFDDPTDVRFLNESSLEVALAPRLSIKWGTSIRFDSRPPTACRVDAGSSCAAEETYRLSRTDLLVENALSLKF